MEDKPLKGDESSKFGATRNDVLLELIKVVGLHLDCDDGSKSTIVQIIKNYEHQEISVSGDNYEVGQAGAVGPAAHAHDNTFVQHNLTLPSDIDLPALVLQLERVRKAMHEEVDTPEQYLEIAEIGLAEKAAQANDGSKVMAHLAKAGKWALEIATKIGSDLVVALLTQAGGVG